MLEGAVGPRGGPLARAAPRYNASCENSAAAALRIDARGPGKPVMVGRETAPSVVIDESLQANALVVLDEYC